MELVLSKPRTRTPLAAAHAAPATRLTVEQAANEYAIMRDGSYGVRVFSGQQLLQSRSYNAAWLRSGQVDEFDVTTQTNALYILRYWGGTCADLDASSPGTAF